MTPTVTENATVDPESAESLTQGNAVVGIYRHHSDAEDAVKDLDRAGIDMRHLSVVGRGYHLDEHPIGYYSTGDRMLHWGKLGAFWGGIWGLLVGSAFFWMPGFGPILMGGPLVTALVGALEGAITVGGFGAVGAALYSIGIPRKSVLEYEAALKTDKYLVVVAGDSDMVDRARDVLGQTNVEGMGLHKQ